MKLHAIPAALALVLASPQAPLERSPIVVEFSPVLTLGERRALVHELVDALPDRQLVLLLEMADGALSPLAESFGIELDPRLRWASSGKVLTLLSSEDELPRTLYHPVAVLPED